MSNEHEKLFGCDNGYTVKDLYEIFGMDEKELNKCMNCRNRRMEGGIITCKYILEGVDQSEG